MSEDSIDRAIRELAARRRLPGAHLDKWLAMDDASRGALAEVAQRLKLRTGQLISAVALLEELSAREGESPAAILAREEIRRASGTPGSAPARAAAFLDALRALRFPRLAARFGTSFLAGRGAEASAGTERRVAQGPAL